MRKAMSLAGVVVALLMVIASCGGGGVGEKEPSLLDSIPGGAGLLLYAQPKKGINDPDVQESFREVAKAADLEFSTLQDALKGLEEQSGLKLGDIDEVLLYVNTEGIKGVIPEGLKEGAVLLRGSFNKEAIVQAARREGSLTSAAYKGQEVLAGNESALAFLSQDLLLVGSEEAVKAVIDVRKGDRASLPSAVRDSFSGLGTPLVKMLFVFPEGFLDEAFKELQQAETPFPVDTKLFTAIKSIGMALDKAGHQFSLSIALDYPDAAAASKASEGVSGMLAFVKSLAADESLNKALGNLKIGASGSQLRLSYSVSAKDVQGVVEALNKLAQ